MARVFTDLAQVFANMDPDTKRAMFQGVNTLYGGMLAGQGRQGEAEFSAANDARSAARQNQLANRQNQLTRLTSDRNQYQSELDAADRLTSQAYGNTPLEFQNERRTMDLKNQALGAGAPSQFHRFMPSWGSGMSSAFGPSAEAEAPYWKGVALASKGRFPGANLDQIYGGEGAQKAQDEIQGTNQWSWDDYSSRWGDYQNDQALQQEALTQLLNTQEQQAQQEYEKSKGSWWKDLLKLLGGAGLNLGLGALTGGLLKGGSASAPGGGGVSAGSAGVGPMGSLVPSTPLQSPLPSSPLPGGGAGGAPVDWWTGHNPWQGLPSGWWMPKK